MWYKKYELYFSEGLKEDIPSNFFTKPYTEKEFESIKKHTDKELKDISIPNYLKLPNEYIELLRVSNGGTIVNENQEFGFFDLKTIREFYLCYGFLIWEQNMLPIAFNGGGTFYTYKFVNNNELPKIYGVHSSCIGLDGYTCFLGNNLEEVLSKKKDIDDYIYEHQVANGIIKSPTITEKEQKIIELSIKLTELKENKNSGRLNLKDYLMKKREIENKLKELKNNYT